MIHHVFFWLKNPSSDKDRQALIAGLSALRKVETIQRIRIGLPAPTAERDVTDHSFQVSYLAEFSTVEGQNTYQSHPLHLKFVKECGHLWARVLVYDAIDI